MKKAPAKMKKKSMTKMKKAPAKFTAGLRKASAEGKLKGKFKKVVDASSKKGETPAMMKKSAMKMKKESMAMMKKSVAMMKKASAMQMKMKSAAKMKKK